MRTNIVLDDKIVDEAFKLSRVRTKKDLINQALEEFVINHRMMNLMDLKGNIQFNDEYDHKKMREGK